MEKNKKHKVLAIIQYLLLMGITIAVGSYAISFLVDEFTCGKNI